MIPKCHTGGLVADCVVSVVSHGQSIASLHSFFAWLSPAPASSQDIKKDSYILVTEMKKCNFKKFLCLVSTGGLLNFSLKIQVISVAARIQILTLLK